MNGLNIHYCIGDLHGRLDLLRAARFLIRSDANKNGYEDCTIVYLGDYVDRGPQSAQTVEELIAVPMEGFKEVALRGNHEDIMLDGLGLGKHPKSERSHWRLMWLENGGVPTLLSYGNYYSTKAWGKQDSYASLEPSNWDWPAVMNSIPQRHIDFMKALPYYYDDGKHFFVHGGVRPDAPVDDHQRQGDAVYSWSRHHDRCIVPYYAVDGRRRLLVHGHTPVKGGRAFESDFRYNLDNGAIWNGHQAVGVFGEPDGPRVIYTPYSECPGIDTRGVPA